MMQLPSTTILCRAVATVSALIVGMMVFSAATAQMPKSMRNESIRSDMPPGIAADLFRMSHPSLINRVQPVRVVTPQDSLVGVGGQNGFTETNASRVTVGMRIGPVYRLKVTNILMNPGKEIFPSIEVLDCIAPPPGQENDFPIQVVITQDDLQQAIEGRLITRVIYLEDPETALPHRHSENQQPSLEVGGAQDPLRAVEGMGRPMAILRIGSRIPLESEMPQAFNFYSMTPELLPDPQAPEDRPGLTDHKSGALSPQQIVPPGTYGPCGTSCAGCSRCPVRRDEYIFDGSDRGEKVRVDRSWNVTGLETEDTVGHYDTLDGRRIVVPSNRVGIYAPRFGAVRRIDGVINAQFNQPVGSVEEKTPLAQSQRSSFSSTTKQHLALQRNQGASRASGFVDRTRGVTADNVVHLFGFRNSFEPYENLQLIRLGTPSSVESARLSIGTLSAKVWEENLGLQIVTKKINPILVKDVTMVQAYDGVELKEGNGFRVTKVASKISARAGEEVEFTIRFDNMTREKIGNVTLIDNLTRRLEYVPGSSECSLKADFIHEQNTGGSLMLRWEIIDPVEPLTGGIIRFRCRVR